MKKHIIKVRGADRERSPVMPTPTAGAEEKNILPELSALVDILRIDESQPSQDPRPNCYRIFVWIDPEMRDTVFADVAVLPGYTCELHARDLIPIDPSAPESLLHIEIYKWLQEMQMGPTRGIFPFGGTTVPLVMAPGRVSGRRELMWKGDGGSRAVGHVTFAMEIGTKTAMLRKCHSPYTIVQSS